MKENLEYNQQKEQTNSKKRDKKWINPQNHVKSGDFPGNKRKTTTNGRFGKRKMTVQTDPSVQFLPLKMSGPGIALW
ncbi:hypothetical protein P7H25_19500 [Paenibacillus larvae]|nr:hypothetical protein [Paenibacillus larvae]MDT2257299.1 hypothetical protein [Paenibacillus larvae]